MRGDIGVAVALSLVFGTVKCDGGSLPGKPVLVSCRSPEKETFSCRWRPGPDAGLPATHRLFYTKENSDETFECPDYQSAGDNSCFFDRNHTSIWVSYWVRVLASNALGNTSSETMEVDVMDIVQPSPPENVSLTMEVLEGNPYLHVKWQPPPETDIRSGWVTVIYQLRVKTAGEEEWEEYLSGKQAYFNLHSLHSGEEYMVQVRCKLDHGHWSSWSDVSYIHLPNYALKQRLLWTVISIISVFLTTAVMCLLIMKRKKVMGWLLPPIPGPKIQGFDSQLLQNRYWEQVLYGLIPQGVPAALGPREHPDEGLVVCDAGDSPPPDVQKAHPRNRSLMAPGFYQLSRPPCGGGSARGLAHGPKAVECEAWLGAGDTDNRSSAEESSEGGPDVPPGAWNTTGGGLKDTGYVAAEGTEKGRLDEKQQYSRVGGLNRDNMVVLEKEKLSLTSLCKENPMDATDQTTLDIKHSACFGLLDNGYVDPVPSLP
ncbi:unnamed protein product [Lota lota]